METSNIDYSTDLDAYAQLLKEYFSILFSPDEKVLLVPGLNKDLFKALCADLADWPKEVGGRKTTYLSKKLGRIQPRRYLNPFSRSPASSSTRNLAALHEINRQGYDIYFAINPMTCRRRCQKTVTMAKHVLIESDENDINAQLRFLKEHEANIVSAVHSGGKSIHCLVRMSPPRLHPGVVGWREACRLGKGETKAPWAEYRRMGDYWIAEAHKHGMEIDTGAAHDHARISRTPGFLHGKTGRRAEVVRLNPSASWDWEDSILESKSSILSIYENQNDDDSFSILNPKTESFCELGETYKDLEETRGKQRPATTSVVRKISQNDQTQSRKTSYLDAMDDIERLRLHGLPGRHFRRSMHRAFFETARVYRWSILQMAREWRRIIKRNQKATIESVKSAVRDMLLAWKATVGVGIYLPDVTRLPDLNDARRKLLQARLIKMRCKEPRKAARIIERVILPLIKSLSRQCLLGTVGVRSTELRNAAHIRGHTRGYKDLWDWMQKVGIVTCKNNEYIPGSRTRQYSISIALVLWLCGFRTTDLDWSPTARNPWPELSRMPVINDVKGDFGAVRFYPDSEQHWVGSGISSPSCWLFNSSAEAALSYDLSCISSE